MLLLSYLVLTALVLVFSQLPSSPHSRCSMSELPNDEPAFRSRAILQIQIELEVGDPEHRLRRRSKKTGGYMRATNEASFPLGLMVARDPHGAYKSSSSSLL